MKNANPPTHSASAAPPGDPLALSDERLRAEILQARDECRPAQWRYAELVAQGESASKALRVAYGSKKKTNPGQPMKVPAVARAVALLREEFARKAGTTAREIRLFWVKLRDEAFTAGKYEAANRANEMLAKLAGMFPEQKLSLRVQHELVDARSFTPEEFELAARLVHEARPQLAAHAVLEVTPESPVALESLQNGPPVRGHSSSQRDGGDLDAA